MRANKINGAKFKAEHFKIFSNKYNNAEPQVMIQTASGHRIRVDAIGYDENGNYVIKEFKSSATAGFTKNQEKGFPDLHQNGGTVIGKRKGDTI